MVVKIILFTLLGFFFLALFIAFQGPADPEGDDVGLGDEVEHIEKFEEFYYKYASPGLTRNLVLERFPPPMNDDTNTIMCWVILGDDEKTEGVVGEKGWKELIKGRDGYYLVFGRDGKLLGGLNTISGWPPDEALTHYSSKGLLTTSAATKIK